MNNLYTEGTYYEDLGTYLGVRKTHYISEKYPHTICFIDNNYQFWNTFKSGTFQGLRIYVSSIKSFSG